MKRLTVILFLFLSGCADKGLGKAAAEVMSECSGVVSVTIKIGFWNKEVIFHCSEMKMKKSPAN